MISSADVSLSKELLSLLPKNVLEMLIELKGSGYKSEYTLNYSENKILPKHIKLALNKSSSVSMKKKQKIINEVVKNRKEINSHEKQSPFQFFWKKVK